MPMVLLGAGLTFVPPLYAPYLAAPRIWGISAATDQQIGGLIMWVPANILVIVLMSVLFIRWMLDQERRQAERERLAWLQEEQERQGRSAQPAGDQSSAGSGEGGSGGEAGKERRERGTGASLPPSVSTYERPGERRS
jgi:hypothetical protein